MNEFKKQPNSQKWGQFRQSNKQKTQVDGSHEGSLEQFPVHLADMDLPLDTHFRVQFSKAVNTINNLTYKNPSNQFYAAVEWWYLHLHHTTVKASHIIESPSINTLYFCVLMAFTQVGDSILVMNPVFTNYISCANKLKRNVIGSPLVRRKLTNNTFVYDIDFEDIARKCKGVKVIVLCNPHNPGGRIWGKEDIDQILQLSNLHGIVLYSDEIFGDLSPSTFTSLTAFSGRIIVANSLSKAFNASSLKGGYAIVREQQLGDTLRNVIEETVNARLSEPTLLFFPIMYSEEGRDWLRKAQRLIVRNYDYAVWRLTKSKIRVHRLEGTYLLLMDFSDYSVEMRRCVPTLQKSTNQLQFLLSRKGVFPRYLKFEYMDGLPRNQIRMSIAIQFPAFIRLMERIMEVIQALDEQAKL